MDGLGQVALVEERLALGVAMTVRPAQHEALLRRVQRGEQPPLHRGSASRRVCRGQRRAGPSMSRARRPLCRRGHRPGGRQPRPLRQPETPGTTRSEVGHGSTSSQSPGHVPPSPADPQGRQGDVGLGVQLRRRVAPRSQRAAGVAGGRRRGAPALAADRALTHRV